jgi:hypothetical protein
MGREIMFAVDVDAEPSAVYEAVSTRNGLRSFWTPDADAEPTVGSEARFGTGRPDPYLRPAAG